MKKLTAKEIADDVQQTFEGISCSYRQILEDRIIDYAKNSEEGYKEALLKIHDIITNVAEQDINNFDERLAKDQDIALTKVFEILGNLIITSHF